MSDVEPHSPAPVQQQFASASAASAPASASSHTPAGPPASFKTDETFRALNLSPQTQRALDEDFKYATMSIVQAKCIPVTLQGADVVAKAKTGTGKTLAFLVPIAERILARRHLLPPPAMATRAPIRALVISPTRELAQQIEEEASRLGKFHGIRLACVVGGLKIDKDIRNISNGLDLLIATPGRLKDLLENYNGVQAQLSALNMLVLDEADRLLDMGFKPDLDRIFSMLPPPSQRQTQLFSATFPPNVKVMTDRTLKREHVVVNTVGDEEDQTHQHVKQESLIVPWAQQFDALYELLRLHKASHPSTYKVIVFFTTARMASFASRLFNQADCPTLELHSRLSQSKRTKTSDQFREGTRAVLFSSDVSARGLDFPGVTLIIQVGLTAKDQYIHRLGRTARAGNEGHGIIILSPFERRFLSTLTPELPITPMHLEAGSTLATLANGQTPAWPAALRKGSFAHPLAYAFSLVDPAGSGSVGDDEDSLKGEASSAYRAQMGFLNGYLRILGWNKEQLVANVNEWSSFIGLREVPTFEAKTVGKMGLKGVAGLRIGASQQGGGGRGGNGGRGGGQQGGRGGGQGGRGGYAGGNGQGRPQSARW